MKLDKIDIEKKGKPLRVLTVYAIGSRIYTYFKSCVRKMLFNYLISTCANNLKSILRQKRYRRVILK